MPHRINYTLKEVIMALSLHKVHKETENKPARFSAANLKQTAFNSVA